ncbi:MAG: DUF1801 domain-containing protein [Actinomycetota bacterium]|nr:DUF1801 domain-containing protein [Actinomycetota bacterium]
MTLEDIVNEHPAEVQRLIRRLRKLIRDALSAAEERVYPVWHGIGYVDRDAGYVCGLFPKRDYVEVGFEYG